MSGSVRRDLTERDYVRRQYATEAGLVARKSVYAEISGPDAREVALDAIREAAPSRVLEVGCGEGELAERIERELGPTVVAVDQSERMVEISRARGVDARIGDVRRLPFASDAFDVVVAAWVLHHVDDVDDAVEEIHRVLRHGGRLVAVTNWADHLLEVWRLAGVDRLPLVFGGENAEAHLRRRFERVERRAADGTVTVVDAGAVRRYVASSDLFADRAALVPELEQPLVARRRPVVFVAEKAP